jgi:hypothetical protein
MDSAKVALTAPNLIGPAWVTFRLAHHRTLSAGELLWAWSGIAWGTFLTIDYQCRDVGYTRDRACHSAERPAIVARFGGPESVRRWEGLGIWYGERRTDPESIA